MIVFGLPISKKDSTSSLFFFFFFLFNSGAATGAVLVVLVKISSLYFLKPSKLIHSNIWKKIGGVSSIIISCAILISKVKAKSK